MNCQLGAWLCITLTTMCIGASTCDMIVSFLGVLLGIAYYGFRPASDRSFAYYIPDTPVHSLGLIIRDHYRTLLLR